MAGFLPFLLLQCTTKSPTVLAWTQVLIALVAGNRNLWLLPPSAGSSILAGLFKCLVLSVDRFLCYLAGVANKPSGLLAALAPAVDR